MITQRLKIPAQLRASCSMRVTTVVYVTTLGSSLKSKA
jgi:hypothetical protein